MDITRPVSRRSVTRTAAWAGPAITVVGAAPAFAASGEFTAVASNVYEQTEATRNRYTLSLTLTNSTGASVSGPFEFALSRAAAPAGFDQVLFESAVGTGPVTVTGPNGGQTGSGGEAGWTLVVAGPIANGQSVTVSVVVQLGFGEDKPDMVVNPVVTAVQVPSGTVETLSLSTFELKAPSVIIDWPEVDPW